MLLAKVVEIKKWGDKNGIHGHVFSTCFQLRQTFTIISPITFDASKNWDTLADIWVTLMYMYTEIINSPFLCFICNLERLIPTREPILEGLIN